MRLRQDPTDQAAWSEFVDHYGPKIMGWCQKWKLQEADAQDVTQNVLLRLAEKLKDFSYDATKSFRAWLRRSRRGPGATLPNHGNARVWVVATAMCCACWARWRPART